MIVTTAPTWCPYRFSTASALRDTVFISTFRSSPGYVLGYCFAGLAKIVALAPLSDELPRNRAPAASIDGLATAPFVYAGWRTGGMIGVAYGILASRLLFLAQDILAIKAIKAHGWLSMGTWLHLGLSRRFILRPDERLSSFLRQRRQSALLFMARLSVSTCYAGIFSSAPRHTGKIPCRANG